MSGSRFKVTGSGFRIYGQEILLTLNTPLNLHQQPQELRWGLSAPGPAPCACVRVYVHCPRVRAPRTEAHAECFQTTPRSGAAKRRLGIRCPEWTVLVYWNDP